MMHGDLRASLLRIEGMLVPRHQVVIDPVLDISAVIRSAKDPLVVGLVLRKQKGDVSLAIQEDFAEALVASRHGANAARRVDFFQSRLQRSWVPCPRVAEPECWQDMDPGCIGSTIASADLDENVLRIVFGILDKDVKVPVRVEDTRV